MTYLRIDRNKFWGWVVVSLLVGLGIGFGTMLLLSSSRSDEVRTLNNRIGAVQAQLTSAEASLTALTDQNAQLTLNLETANAQIASLQGTSSSTTDTSTPTPAVSLVVVSRTVTPSTVATSGTITMTAKVTGKPTKVTMRVYIKATPRTFDKTYTLKLVSTSGNTQTWRLKASAPKKVGTYLYFATAIRGSTKVTKTGASASTFKVH